MKIPFSDHIQIHEDKVAYASSHHKQMEDLVGTEILMLCIEDRQFQGVDDSAYGVDDPAGKEPEECVSRQCVPQRAENGETCPPHGDIEDGRKPFRAGDPADVDNHSGDGDTPYCGEQRIAESVSQNDETDRCVGAGDQHEDHHVIQLAEYF